VVSQVFFDIAIGGRAAGRVVMELYANTTPKTAANFLALCKGACCYLNASVLGLLHRKISVFLLCVWHSFNKIY
jgi:cyclophilin family peptidyl-prolyl cis-trans isomerase